VCVGHDRKSCKMAEPIKMPFGEGDLPGPRNRVLGGRMDWSAVQKRGNAFKRNRQCASSMTGSTRNF